MRAAVVGTTTALIAAVGVTAATADPSSEPSEEQTNGQASLEELGLAPGDSGLADPFYQPPAELPAAGSMIRTEAATHLLGMAGIGWPGSAEKILYSSTNDVGETVAVSGVVIEPSGSWDGAGERPTVVVAPGTMGQGDQCAPSNQEGLLASFDSDSNSVGFNYEILNAYTASALGMRVVITDYIGMGTPGVHTYMNRVDQGNAVIDAARAALSHAGLPADSPVGFLGYSQGGGAAASATELVGSYAPELNLKGTYAGAPPADLSAVVPAVDQGLIFGVLGYSLNSGLEYREDLATLVTEHLNDKGAKFLQDSREHCLLDSIINYPLTDSSTLTSSGNDFATLLSDIPEIKSYIDDQKLGQLNVSTPIMVQSGVSDDVIPYDQAAQLGRDYCGQGSAVSFHTNTIPSILPKSALGHMLPMLSDIPVSMQYLNSAFNGEELSNDCGSF